MVGSRLQSVASVPPNQLFYAVVLKNREAQPTHEWVDPDYKTHRFLAAMRLQAESNSLDPVIFYHTGMLAWVLTKDDAVFGYVAHRLSSAFEKKITLRTNELFAELQDGQHCPDWILPIEDEKEYKKHTNSSSSRALLTVEPKPEEANNQADDDQEVDFPAGAVVITFARTHAAFLLASINYKLNPLLEYYLVDVDTLESWTISSTSNIFTRIKHKDIPPARYSLRVNLPHNVQPTFYFVTNVLQACSRKEWRLGKQLGLKLDEKIQNPATFSTVLWSMARFDENSALTPILVEQLADKVEAFVALLKDEKQEGEKEEKGQPWFELVWKTVVDATFRFRRTLSCSNHSKVAIHPETGPVVPAKHETAPPALEVCLNSQGEIQSFAQHLAIDQ
eukprot:TRINITY_DN61687_c0_g1_i1.p1 TRINITY_DN61687_c0_g1~~TRINITY_DN61687_c0_g1_i1.p1  ORF type:complete len:392 (-),score=13.24 TRINITY_DN61687_c0_g1_i1:387-1562(-)